MISPLARLASACLAAIALAATSAHAAPFLALHAAGGSATATTVVLGSSAPLSLDVALDTTGATVSGVEFHLTSTSAVAKYANAAPFTLLTPFVAGDVGASPSAGAAITADVALFKGSVGDYAAQAGTSIVRLGLDVSTLAKGTYTFTPHFDVFTNATTPDMESGFGPAGAFTLTVAAAPEPATLVAAGGVAGLAIARRRPRQRHRA